MDYHIHSHYSADTDEQMEGIILEAIGKNIDEICFTDHIDYDYTDDSLNFNFDVIEYKKEIDIFKEKYGDKINIITGLELGIQPHILDKCKNIVIENSFDFVIASMHTCNREDLYLGDYFKNKTADEALKGYILEMTNMLNQFTNYSVIGHIDLLKRYNKDVADIDPSKFEKEYIDLLNIIIKSGKGIEVNTSGLRQGVKEQFPSEYLLKLYKSLGGTILTLGSDSHSKIDLEKNFEDAKEILKKIGFTKLYKFEKMKAIEYSIE